MGVLFLYLVRRIYLSGMYLVSCIVIYDVRNIMVIKEIFILRKLFNFFFAFFKSLSFSCCIFLLEFLNSKWYLFVKKEVVFFW